MAIESLSTEPSTPAPNEVYTEGDERSLRWRLLRECDAMARHAFSAGLKVPPGLLQSLSSAEGALKGEPSEVSLSEIGSLHAELATVVAPALPRTIYLLQHDRARKGWISVLGPLPTVRRLMLAAFFFTLVFVLSSLSPYINTVTLALNIYRMHGLILLNVLLFLISAAGIGASFRALFIVHSYIEEGTYDPRYDSSYWTQIGLGLISGLVISQLVPIGPELNSQLATNLEKLLHNTQGMPELYEKMTSDDLGGNIFSKPLMALLGGFSSTMVYTVMQRLVDTMESLFKSKNSESRDEREQRVRSQVTRHFSAHVMPLPPANTPASGTNGDNPSARDSARKDGPSAEGVIVPLHPQGQQHSPQPSE